MKNSHPKLRLEKLAEICQEKKKKSLAEEITLGRGLSERENVAHSIS